MSTEANKPVYHAYIIPEREGAGWIKIGAAWPHRDGSGINIQLDLTVTPATRLVLRKPDDKPATEA